MSKPIRMPDYVMTFGIFKGRTLKWISGGYPSYIRWMVEKNVLRIDEDFANSCTDYRWSYRMGLDRDDYPGENGPDEH